MIGWPDSDGIDAVTGKPTKGVGTLEGIFEAKHPDIDLKISGVLIGYARSLNLFGKSAKVDFILPVARLQGEAAFFGQPVERDVTGANDPLARLTILFNGAPAMSAAMRPGISRKDSSPPSPSSSPFSTSRKKF